MQKTLKEEPERNEKGFLAWLKNIFGALTVRGKVKIQQG